MEGKEEDRKGKIEGKRKIEERKKERRKIERRKVKDYWLMVGWKVFGNLKRFIKN